MNNVMLHSNGTPNIVMLHSKEKGEYSDVIYSYNGNGLT